MTTKCPCCGSAVEKMVLTDGVTNVIAIGDIMVRMPPRFVEVIRVLVRAMPNAVHRDVLISVLWNYGSEPENVDNNLYSIISQIRHALVDTQLSLKTVYMGGYRLERRAPKQVVAMAVQALQEAACAG